MKPKRRSHSHRRTHRHNMETHQLMMSLLSYGGSRWTRRKTNAQTKWNSKLNKLELLDMLRQIRVRIQFFISFWSFRFPDSEQKSKTGNSWPTQRKNNGRRKRKRRFQFGCLESISDEAATKRSSTSTNDDVVSVNAKSIDHKTYTAKHTFHLNSIASHVLVIAIDSISSRLNAIAQSKGMWPSERCPNSVFLSFRFCNHFQFKLLLFEILSRN